MKRKILYKMIIGFTGLLVGTQVEASHSPGPRKIYFQHIKSKKIDSTEVDFYGNTRFGGIQSGQYRLSFVSKDHLIQNQKFTTLPIYSLKADEVYHFDNTFFIQNTLVNGNINCDKVGKVYHTKTKDSRPKTLEKRPHGMTPRILHDGISKSKSSVESDEISAAWTIDDSRDVSTSELAPDAPPSLEMGERSDDALVVGATPVVIDGLKVIGTSGDKKVEHKESIARLTPSTRSEDVSKVKTASPEDEFIKAGIITAGRWSDLENWTKFQKTHEDPSIRSIQNQWGFNLLDRRISVKLTNEEGIGIPLQRLQLRNNRDSVIWTSVTDNNGLAELWANPFSSRAFEKSEKYNLFVLSGERWNSLGKVSTGNNSIEEFRLNLNAPTFNEVDVCFVMDATGSMGDEIRYLQKELSYFAQNAQKSLPCSKIRISSVFYRDIGDAYVSKSSDFTDRVDDILGFISEQSAGGGGDFPEAVDAGLSTAIHELKWSEGSIAKILFLVLDAPPHTEKAKEIRELIQAASAKGIRIIPITASGINTSTEFLMKYMASMTGGEYVYITDHSGVGNSHIKPTGVKENMDLLKNQWMNILIKYSQYGKCDEVLDSQFNPIKVDPRRNIFGNQQVVIETYPNPATNYIDIESNTQILGIKWYDMNHRLIYEVKNEQNATKKSRFEFPVQVPGLYLLEVSTTAGNFVNKTMLTNGYRS